MKKILVLCVLLTGFSSHAADRYSAWSGWNKLGTTGISYAFRTDYFWSDKNSLNIQYSFFNGNSVPVTFSFAFEDTGKTPHAGKWGRVTIAAHGYDTPQASMVYITRPGYFKVWYKDVVLGNGGGGGTGGGGGGGGGTVPSVSKVQIIGGASYKVSGKKMSVSISKILNSGTAGSGALKVDVVASTRPYAESSTVYVMSSFQLNGLKANYYYESLNKSLSMAFPPKGSYYVSLRLFEQTSAGWTLRQVQSFPGTVTVRSASDENVDSGEMLTIPEGLFKRYRRAKEVGIVQPIVSSDDLQKQPEAVLEF